MLSLLVAASVVTAVDAERAFAADAQKLGQWTAFQKWSTADAIMFLPQPSNAHAFLKDRKNPPAAVFWWPGRSYVSCDGSFAVNTGPWVRGWGKSVGYFTTVWQRQPDGGWKWIYDAGDELKAPRAEGGDIKQIQASCSPVTKKRQHGPITTGIQKDGGTSPDNSMGWMWWVKPDGSRALQVSVWNGSMHELVINDQVAAPPR